MTHTDLQQIQTRIKFDAPSMAACLGIPYEQYRHYYYGHLKIPADVERRVRELESFEMQLDQERIKRIDAEIIRQFPNWILSEVEA